MRTRTTTAWSLILGVLCGVTAVSRALGQGPGASEESPCLKCHASVRAAIARKTVHAAVTIGCESCHEDHRKAGGAAKKEQHYLTAAQAELCATCHDYKDKTLVAAHRAQPFEKSVCTGCHQPHGSDRPKLLQTEMHPPFEARQCESCHATPDGGKIRLTETTPNATCYLCHDQMKERLTTVKSKHSLLATSDNSCMECHDPHATKEKRYLKERQTALCGNCHGDVTSAKKHPHEALKAGCTICHDAHGSNEHNNLRAKINTVCLGCHGENGFRVVASQGREVELYQGIKLIGGIFEDIKILVLRDGAKKGHPYTNHPVEGDSHGAAGAITCVTCHLPHGGNGARQMYVTEDTNSGTLCVKCHK